MRSLLDVNVLIALFDPDHTLHEPAARWFESNARDGWASCPLTQNGFVRVVLSPTERSVPLYERTGFGPADALMLRTPPPWRPSIV